LEIIQKQFKKDSENKAEFKQANSCVINALLKYGIRGKKMLQSS
jgi:hypothetical protein